MPPDGTPPKPALLPLNPPLLRGDPLLGAGPAPRAPALDALAAEDAFRGAAVPPGKDPGIRKEPALADRGVVWTLCQPVMPWKRTSGAAAGEFLNDEAFLALSIEELRSMFR